MITLALDDGLFRRVLAHGEDGSALVVANKVVTPFPRLTDEGIQSCLVQKLRKIAYIKIWVALFVLQIEKLVFR